MSTVDHGKANMKYDIDGVDKNTVLQLTVLQKNAQTKVQSGENGGRTLSHVQIVRKLQSVSLKGSVGAVTLALPEGFNTREWEIIGFLQNTANGVITGASRAVFESNANIGSADLKNSN
jgi:hypothetical protein